jgi:hypothetical protein
VDTNALRCSSILPGSLLVVYSGGEEGVCGGEKESTLFGMISEMPRVMRINDKSFLWDMG